MQLPHQRSEHYFLTVIISFFSTLNFFITNCVLIFWQSAYHFFFSIVLVPIYLFSIICLSSYHCLCDCLAVVCTPVYLSFYANACPDSVFSYIHLPLVIFLNSSSFPLSPSLISFLIYSILLYSYLFYSTLFYPILLFHSLLLFLILFVPFLIFYILSYFLDSLLFLF